MISVIMSCMNRLENLRISLQSWIDFELIEEIIITDWSSSVPLSHELLPQSDKLKLIRVNNQKTFSLSRSLNVAFDFVNQDSKILCKIDTDYILTNKNIFFDILTPSTFDGSKLKRPIFFTGHWMFDESLSGFLIVNKKDFVYYNEEMYGWGFEDQDLYLRLINNGLQQIIIPGLKKYVYHIPHTEFDRLSNYEIKDKKISLKSNKAKHDVLYSRPTRTYNKTVVSKNFITIDDL